MGDGVVALATGQTAQPQHSRVARGGERDPFAYALFGLRVQSDFPLPAPRARAADDLEPDLVFARGSASRPAPPEADLALAHACNCPRHRGRVILRLFRSGDGIWVEYEDAGLYHVMPGGRRVEVYRGPEGDADPRALGYVLAGPIATLALYQRGVACLHASAVVVDGAAVAFLGPKGQGKSSMAAGLLRRGASLLTDDVLPLEEQADGIYGRPSLPILKLWDRSVEGALGLNEKLPVVFPGVEKRLVSLEGRFPFAEAPARLRALYVLDRYDPAIAGAAGVSIERLSLRDAFLALVGQTSIREMLLPSEIAQRLPVYARLSRQAPVRVVRFPDGFEHQDRVHERILADLQEVP